MKTKKALINPIKHIVAVGALTALASTAHALVPVDGWQLDTTNGTNVGAQLFTDIGHLNLSGGEATVEQEISLITGTPFAGASFTEFGQIFSVSYTPENCVGLCDSGEPSIFFQDGLLLNVTLEFTGLTGSVESYDAATGRIDYLFDPGVGSVNLLGSTDGNATQDILASFSLISPSGGDLGDFEGIGDESQGQSTISALVLDSISNVFRDSLGESFDERIDLGNLFALVVTTNKINPPGFGEAGACSFKQAVCVTGNVTSDGSFDLLEVPVPAPLALLGLGLVLMGGMRKKTAA